LTPQNKISSTFHESVSPLKLFVHDYSGHAFPVQLSREMARRGHRVVHAYSAAVESPRGGVALNDADPSCLTINAIGRAGSLNKYALLHRVKEERKYGDQLADAILQEDPDVVILCTTPNDVLDRMNALPSRMRVIWWLQDIYSIGIRSVLNRRLPLMGNLAGAIYHHKEKRFAARADHIVSITPDFIPHLRRLGAPAEKISVIENWAPVNELLPAPLENAWKAENGLSGKRLIVYSGTLGLKHNPAVLAKAAQLFQDQGRQDVRIVVATQGLGADFLKAEIGRRSLRNLVVLPWQPYERLAEMLSSAEILTAIIEPEASLFSVPSKILSCFCVGRPLVASLPTGNLAARTIEAAGAGFVVPPGDDGAFIARLEKLLGDADLRARLGAAGRAYAEEKFDIAGIAKRFLAVLNQDFDRNVPANAAISLVRR
jgi:colanic acid biosynthesis glycosyl transferase WcaI